MSIDKLKRVIWRLEESSSCDDKLPERMLRNAIMQEIGTNEVTIKNNIGKLVELGWIKRVQYKRWIIVKDNLPGEI